MAALEAERFLAHPPTTLADVPMMVTA